MQCLDEKSQRIKELENENIMVQEKVNSMENNVEILTQAVLQAAKQRFGASSEKTPSINGQCVLFDELIDSTIDETENNVIDIKEHKRPIRKKGDRERLIKTLPHEVVECILNEDEAVCNICNSEFKIIGKKKVRSEIEYIPAKLIMKDYVQYVYKCTECGKSDVNPYDSIVSAPVPAPVLTHSFASSSIVSWVMYQKYVMSVPLYRQEKDFRRMGAEIKGSGGSIGRAYCDKLFKLERQWKTLSPEERKKNRLIKSVPVLDAFFSWAENTFTNQDKLKKALNYTLNHKKYFTNFLLYGRIPLSNNLSEIAVKPVAITRKNSLFSDSTAGANASAIIFSIVNTAAANNLDAYKYLEYLFKNLPNIKLPLEPSVLCEYLPWSEKIQSECKTTVEEEYCNESA